MKFNTEIQKYIKGELFFNSLEINYSTLDNIPRKRIDFIVDQMKDKRVVHLGCCDHIPHIDAKMKNNTWLHSRLSSVAKNCIGIDIDQNSIDYLISKYNISNVVSADITSDKIPEIESHHWDYLVMGEILEHVNNPTSFLEAIKKNYQGIIDRLFITVPNAFYYTNFAKALKNTEIINSDHRYTFTPYTLAKIVHEAGMEVESFYFTHDLDRKIGLRAKLKIFPFIKRRLLYNRMEKNPLLRDTLVMIIKTNS